MVMGSMTSSAIGNNETAVASGDEDQGHSNGAVWAQGFGGQGRQKMLKR